MSVFPHSEPEFSRFLVREYFKFGSVDEVLRHYRFSLPVSYATYQRVLNRFGVVKKASSGAKLSETIDFFEHLVKDNINIERLYKNMPHSFQVSLKTLYRVYSYMKEGLTRRVGVALVISPYDDLNTVLLARDVSTPSLKLGKRYGAWSLPMGYTRKRDSRKTGIIRILQNEVFTSMVWQGVFPYSVVSDLPEPFMYLDIADVRVAVYSLSLPKELSDTRKFSSYKLEDHRFLKLEEAFKIKNSRVGVFDILNGYKRYLECFGKKLVVNPIQSVSVLNKGVIEFSLEIDR